MKTYIKYLIYNFLKSFLFVFFIIFCLIIILNILSEIEYFKNYNVETYFPIYISILNSADLIFEMYPFIFLLSTQIFFIYLINDNQIQIFKYSGLKNSNIVNIISILSLIMGIFIITIFYSFSSNLKNIYLELKNKYTSDSEYLAVITKNGLWIKDIDNENIKIINASKIDGNTLNEVFISEFDKNYNLIRNITSKKVDVSRKNWLLFNAKIYEKNSSEKLDNLNFYSNFDIKKINDLYSDLSSLSLIELFDLRKNYKQINYSTIEVDLQIHKLLSYPFYFTLMTIFASLIMFNTKKLNNNTLKILVGLFFSVIVYYINNFFYVLGKTEKMPMVVSVWLPLIILSIVNFSMITKVNHK